MPYTRDPGTYHAAKEVELHIHNYEYWCGIAAGHDNDPGNQCCDRESAVGYTFTSGSGAVDPTTWAFGAWLCVIGNSDLPNKAGNVKYDPHRINVIDVSIKNVEMKIQLAYGNTSADATANVAASNSSDFVFAKENLKAGATILNALMKRCDIDEPLWGRLAAKGRDAATATGFIGIHEYPPIP